MGNSLLSNRNIGNGRQGYRDRLKITYHRMRSKEALWASVWGSTWEHTLQRNVNGHQYEPWTTVTKYGGEKGLKEYTAPYGKAEHHDKSLVEQTCSSHICQKTEGKRRRCLVKRKTLQSQNFRDLIVAARAQSLIAQSAMSPKMRLRSS